MYIIMRVFVVILIFRRISHFAFCSWCDLFVCGCMRQVSIAFHCIIRLCFTCLCHHCFNYFNSMFLLCYTTCNTITLKNRPHCNLLGNWLYTCSFSWGRFLDLGPWESVGYLSCPFLASTSFVGLAVMIHFCGISNTSFKHLYPSNPFLPPPPLSLFLSLIFHFLIAFPHLIMIANGMHCDFICNYSFLLVFLVQITCMQAGRSPIGTIHIIIIMYLQYMYMYACVCNVYVCM